MVEYYEKATPYHAYPDLEMEKELSSLLLPQMTSLTHSIDSSLPSHHSEQCELTKLYRGYEASEPTPHKEESKSEIDKITRYFEILEFLEKDLKTGKFGEINSLPRNLNRKPDSESSAEQGRESRNLSTSQNLDTGTYSICSKSRCRS